MSSHRLTHTVFHIKAASNRVASKRGVSFLVAFEIEFIPLKTTLPEAEPISKHDWSNTASIYTGSTGDIVLEEIADALQAG